MKQKVNKTTETGSSIDHVSAAVSLRVKTQRREQKLSLDELARRSGVSKGMLVEIEKGSANPSIAILCKVAAALGLSVADIVDVTDEPLAHVILAQDIPVLWQGEKGGHARLLAGTRGPDMIELWRWEMLPGEQFSSEGHPQRTWELLHVEEGELTLSVEGILLQVSAGNSAVAKTATPHSYANHSSQRLVFTMTVAELHS
ncbi:helix-turn-helix domain-containing protein [Erwiniaceae bacterium L1_54_6]|jgi:transcriptional regulator with XRE-family HTH domain|uniref:XRE family transcriptional regulator n=1 Tax=Pantoea cypripedii TaxID=55209 RepID=A0A6B9G8Z0_PANCY|nr:helix-turn-helix transcriptional regulator [Pantoea cypripedii]MDF7658869.1 helix-turn-helix domain-containing protein [Erwiniaceae bacterium L1_54_6]QGY31800.1 XRE family transcriptional regulator [Pantoea cypripedii]